MYRPFLLVGLGGSGGKTLRFAKQEVQKRLIEMGWDEGIPAAWQFLHIDTPTQADGNELNALVDPLSSDEYLGLVDDGVTFKAVTGQLDRSAEISQQMVGWRIDPARLDVPISMGAGQYRAVGRTISMVQGKSIRSRLTSAIDRATTAAAGAELRECFTTTHPDSSGGTPAAPIVVVVSSLAGGTGAGILMNVCDLLKSVIDRDEVFAFLYTPEVFGARGGVGDGVFPNSLAAICEVINGKWWQGEPGGEPGSTKVPPRHNPDLTLAGAARPLMNSGPDFPFLVGLRNKNGSSFSGAVELFSAIGAGLATTITDHRLQDGLFAYEVTNWELNAKALTGNIDVLNAGDPAGPFDGMGHGMVQALGTARLSIGLDRFEEYAAQRIAKDAARYMANHHIDSDEARQVAERYSTNDPDEIAGYIADGLLDHFLHTAGLSERGADRNQVKDALRPDETSLSAMKSQARNQATQLSQIGTGGTTDSRGWASRISDAIFQARVPFQDAYRQALQQNVHAWIGSHPQRVLAVVEDFIGRHGTEVAVAVIERAVHYLEADNGVVAELRGDHELGQYRRGSDDAYVLQNLSAPLQGLGASVEAHHAALSEALEEGLWFMAFSGEALLCETAAYVLESFASTFLQPLAAALRSEVRAIDEELRSEAANWANWTDANAPQELQPPVSEVTLIEGDEFAETFDACLRDSYRDVSEQETRRINLRQEIISGSFLRDGEAALDDTSHALTSVAQWTPGAMVDPLEVRPQTSASFRLALRPTELKKRAHDWMRQPNAPFDRLLSNTLRTYLGADPVFGSTVPTDEMKRRQRRFQAKLQQLFSVADPLVGLDTTLEESINPGLGVRRNLSNLPFASHELEDTVATFLRTELGDGAERLLNDDAHIRHITAFTRFTGAVSPLIISSLFRPISEDWAIKSATQVGRAHFWSRRRARRLEEFIPVTQEALAAMCRGWFIGVALGLIDRSADPIPVGRPSDPPVAFPHPTLTSTGSARDQLAVVMESLALAYVNVNLYQSVEPLLPYTRLRDLGRDAFPESTLYTYDVDPFDPKMGTEVEHWIMHGEVKGQLSKSLVDGMTPAERITSMIDVLGKARSQYAPELEELRERWSKDPGSLGSQPYWPGMDSHILEALGALQRAFSTRLEGASTSTEELESL